MVDFQKLAEMNWMNTEIYHVTLISSFDVPNHEELKKSFNGEKTLSHY